jgi:hypothetical protein
MIDYTVYCDLEMVRNEVFVPFKGSISEFVWKY